MNTFNFSLSLKDGLAVLRIVVMLLSTALTAAALALPSLGLTQVATDADSTSKLAVIDGAAYVSHHAGVSLVDMTGVTKTIVPESSIFQSPYQPTRVVRGEDGGVYVGMNYSAGGEFGNGGAELFRLSNPTQTLASWDGLFALGFSSQLLGIGRSAGSYWNDVRLHSDGGGSVLPGISPLPGNGFHATDVLPGGFVVGNAGIPGTIGSAGVILDQDDNLDFPFGYGFLTSGRERADGDGVNSVHDLGYGTFIIYGSHGVISVNEVGVIVSETDFTLLGRADGDYFVFLSGVNQVGDDLAVPLLDYFPELSTLDFRHVTDISSANGQVHLLLSGDDGLWLYSAVDPTWGPEPTTAVLLACAVAPLVGRRHA